MSEAMVSVPEVSEVEETVEMAIVVSDKIKAKEFLPMMLAKNSALVKEGKVMMAGNVAYDCHVHGVDPKSGLKQFFVEIGGKTEGKAKIAAAEFMSGKAYRRSERAASREFVETQLGSGRYLKGAKDGTQSGSITFAEPYKVANKKRLSPTAQLDKQRGDFVAKLVESGKTENEAKAILAVIM